MSILLHEQASAGRSRKGPQGLAPTMLRSNDSMVHSRGEPLWAPCHPTQKDTLPPAHEQSSYGKVFLVGAGPGDPELITLKGLRSLHKADVVVYDRLICPDLLDEAPLQAERVFVGKTAGHHSMKQEEINALLIMYARRGCIVVRLKGGDPFVFGRGGEEALALAQAGIPFEVVPGVSSAIAVPAYAGIPVTQRGLASSVTIVTGHEQCNDGSYSVNWEALAALGGTLVILMGVETLSHITQRLLNGGLHPNTPAAVIQQGTVPQQRVVTDTLVGIAERARIAKIQSPAVVVIGAVVALSDLLAWFEERAGTSHSPYTPELMRC